MTDEDKTIDPPAESLKRAVHPEDKFYLGAGVYVFRVSFSTFVLTVKNGATIYLNEQVLEALRLWLSLNP